MKKRKKERGATMVSRTVLGGIIVERDASRRVGSALRLTCAANSATKPLL